MRKGMLRGNQPKQIVRLRFRNFVKSFAKINRFNFTHIWFFKSCHHESHHKYEKPQ